MYKLRITIQALTKEGEENSPIFEGILSITPGSTNGEIQDAVQRLSCNLLYALKSDVPLLDKG